MIAYERYRSGNGTYLVVDATNYVRNRRAFARRHCDSEAGVSDSGSRQGADGVLFLALESEFRPPRVVTTLVRVDGQRVPECPDATRCAAAWAARRVETDRVMIDTQAGTRKAVVHDDAAVRNPIEVSVEVDQSRGRRPESRPEPRSASGRPAVGVTDGGRVDAGPEVDASETAEPAFASPENELTVARGSVVRESEGEVPEVEP